MRQADFRSDFLCSNRICLSCRTRLQLDCAQFDVEGAANCFRIAGYRGTMESLICRTILPSALPNMALKNRIRELQTECDVVDAAAETVATNAPSEHIISTAVRYGSPRFFTAHSHSLIRRYYCKALLFGVPVRVTLSKIALLRGRAGSGGRSQPGVNAWSIL